MMDNENENLKNYGNLDVLDLDNDPMDIIHRYVLNRMEAIYEVMYEEDNLCDEVGSLVVAEFKFKGNRENVLAELHRLIQLRRNIPYTEMDRGLLKDQFFRYRLAKQQQQNSPIRKELRKLNSKMWEVHSDELYRQIDDLKSKLSKSKSTMHKKKECICFCNN